MNEVEQIVEEILIENDIDFDHPVVPYLFEGVENTLQELSIKTLRNYATGAKYDAKHHEMAGMRDYDASENAKRAKVKGMADWHRERSSKSFAKRNRRNDGRNLALNKIGSKQVRGVTEGRLDELSYGTLNRYKTKNREDVGKSDDIVSSKKSSGADLSKHTKRMGRRYRGQGMADRAMKRDINRMTDHHPKGYR